MNRVKPMKKRTKAARKPASGKNQRPLTKIRRRHKNIDSKRGINKKKSKMMRKTLASKTKKAIAVAKPVRKKKVVRIMGHGQFTVDNKTLKKLNEIDNALVQLVRNNRSDDAQFRNRLVELTTIVEKNGKQLDLKEIIQSDIVLPSADLSIDEAKKFFEGEGVIPEI